MLLTYQSHLRSETDEAVIANLTRKGWTETVPPSHSATQHPAEWVNGAWLVRDKTTEDVAAARKALYPDAEMYQVHDWMHDNGLDPDAVPQIIAAAFPPGLERKKALSRWNKAVRVPRDHPLVNVIGTRLTPPLTPAQIDTAWAAIRTR